MVFPVVMYGCESWTIKKAECQRIDAFELWCWRRLLRVRWTASRSNQSILKEINPEYSLGELMLKLKLQYFGHVMWRDNSLEKTLTPGKTEGRRRERQRMRWMASPTQWTWVWVNSGSWWWTGRPGVLQSMGSQRVGHNWVTELNWYCYIYLTSLTFKTYCRNLSSSFAWVHDTLSFFKILLGYFSECPLHLLKSCLPDQSYFNSMFIRHFLKVTINLPQ